VHIVQPRPRDQGPRRRAGCCNTPSAVRLRARRTRRPRASKHHSASLTRTER
jgi:hypothetical protein